MDNRKSVKVMYRLIAGFTEIDNGQAAITQQYALITIFP
jgi:hypothetical protein